MMIRKKAFAVGCVAAMLLTSFSFTGAKASNLSKKEITPTAHELLIKLKDIAKEVGLSATPTYERIKRLEADGYIKKYVAVLDGQKLGLDIVVYYNVTLKEQKINYLNCMMDTGDH